MFYKDISGEWKFTKIPKRFNQVYAESLVKYFNFLDPLFEKAARLELASLSNLSRLGEEGAAEPEVIKKGKAEEEGEEASDEEKAE